MMHAAAPATPSRLNEYYELCKPRVVMLIVFTAVVGMFLAVPGLPPWGPFVWGTLGIGLQASSERLKLVIPACFILILLLLYGALGSVRDAAIVFTGVPFALEIGRAHV